MLVGWRCAIVATPCVCVCVCVCVEPFLAHGPNQERSRAVE